MARAQVLARRFLGVERARAAHRRGFRRDAEHRSVAEIGD
jgi:hypothetical protein